jgi:hypothetical protein
MREALILAKGRFLILVTAAASIAYFGITFCDAGHIPMLITG